MSEARTRFEWNSEQIEKRQALLGKIQLGLIGLAIGLLLIDQAKPWFLLPMALIFFFASRELRQTDKLNDQWQQATITLAPKSLLIEQPAIEQQRRITFRSIAQIDYRTRLGVETIHLQTQEEGTIELPAFTESEQLRKLLKEQLAPNS